MVSISLVMSVIVTNIYLRKDTQTRVPRCLRRLLMRNDDDVTKPVSATRPVPPPPPPPPTSNGKVRQRNGDVWTVGGGQGCDDVELASAHRPVRRPVVDSSDADDDVVEVRDRRSRDHPLVPDDGRQHRQTHRLDRAVRGQSSEWQDLARIIDRLFFWLFMVFSVGLLTGLYVSLLTGRGSTLTDDDIVPPQ